MPVVLGSGWVVADSGVPFAGGPDVRGLRPLSRASRLVCAAAGAALGHPEPLPVPPERCAVVLGTRFASLEPLVEFDRVAAVEGPELVNPSSFPNVVGNVHAAYLGILFGLAGPNVTLCGRAAGLDALGQAIDLLELGRAELVLAGGVDAHGPTLSEGLRRIGADEPDEAAALVLLAREGTGARLERVDLDRLARGGDAGAAVGALAVVQALERPTYA